MRNQFRIRLKELRKEKKVIQTKLGKHLGYGYTAIANYESGRNEPSLDTLIHIADYFDVTLDYLLGREEQRQKGVGLSKMEHELIGNFRQLTEKEKVIVLNLMKIFRENKNT